MTLEAHCVSEANVLTAYKYIHNAIKCNMEGCTDENNLYNDEDDEDDGDDEDDEDDGDDDDDEMMEMMKMMEMMEMMKMMKLMKIMIWEGVGCGEKQWRGTGKA